MKEHGYQLGLIELKGVYVTPCTQKHLEKLAAQRNISIGQMIGILIDKAGVRFGAEDFMWSKGIRPKEKQG